MRFLNTIIAAVSLFVAGAAAANTQFCTQDQKQLANKLHEQNEDPAKSCYRAANGDITTLATTRLCPLSECVAWLEYMAANAPDCYYDSTNYATAYAAKSAACTSGVNESASGSASASLSSSSSLSSSGSEGSANLLNMTSSGSLDTMSEDRDINTTDSRNGFGDSSTVGSLASVGENVGSSSSDLEIETSAAPTPTPTEDLTIEDSPSAGTSGSSNSSTPTPTTNAAASLDSIHSLVAVLFIAAAAIVIEQK